MTQMSTTQVTDPQRLEAALDELKQDLGGAPQLAVVLASPRQPLGEALVRVSDALPGAQILGSTTAGEFAGESETAGGLVVAAVRGDFEVQSGFAVGLAEDAAGTVARAVSGFGEPSAEHPHRTALVFVDALSFSGEEAALLVSALIGDAQIAGAAAGDDLQLQRTLVGAGREAASNAIAVALIASKRPLGIGCRHGHTPLSGPMTVTKASGPLVLELDGKPAWTAYAEAIREDAQASCGLDPFALPSDEHHIQLFGRYEAGLEIGDDLYKVRAPLQRAPGDALAFATALPEGSIIRIMHTHEDALVASAAAAAAEARAHCGGEVAGALAFDCAVRKMCLRERFPRALAAMRTALGGAPLAGFEAYGEIALEVGDMSGFHNSTTVVLAFPV